VCCVLLSGDWFNRIDWTGQHNNFGIGMPPGTKNYHQWAVKGPRLTAWHKYKPSSDIIARQAAFFKALLKVRSVGGRVEARQPGDGEGVGATCPHVHSRAGCAAVALWQTPWQLAMPG
jgi:hypothetical protein